ncbi:MAG: cytochrome c biogenesis protein ResB [Geothermobacteraceae bacterium]
MTVHKKEPSVVSILWDFFCSLKLAIITLILLAITSIVGTVIQQGRPAQEYIREYGETAYRVFVALDFVDMYHSWWFLTLLNIFAINLICCSIKRLPRILKLVRQPELTPDERHYRGLSNKDEFTVATDAGSLREYLVARVGRQFAFPVVHEKEGAIHLFAQKMAWARFGVYAVHLSILIIFAGAIIGNVWGYKAYVNIPEGGSTDKVWPQGQENPIPIGFEVRCDDFEVTFYPGSRRPKEFTSDLVVLENGKEVLRKTIEVNDPLTWRGLTFYQSSYGPAGDPVFDLVVTEQKTGEKVSVRAKLGEHVPLPGGRSFAVTNYTDDYQNFGPAIQLHVNSEDGKHGRPFVVLQRFPDFDIKRGGIFAFALTSYEEKFYTGLQVAKDPGVWVVWAGCALMVLGCFAAFFLSHRRIWLSIVPRDGVCLVRIGGQSHRNQPAFALWFEAFVAELREGLPEAGDLAAGQENCT